MRFILRYLAPTLAVLLVGSAIGWGQYTNWPNGATGTTVGSIMLLDVVSTPPAYTNGTVQPGTQDLAGNLNINCQVGCSASSDPANGPVSPGAAGTKSKLGGLVFNTVAPTFTNGQQGALQGDVNGNLMVNIQQTVAPQNGPVAPGTAATKSVLGGGVFNTVAPTVANGQQVALQVDANGFLKVDISAGGASGGTSSTFGAAFPTLGTAMGMSQGGNMVAVTGTAGNLNVNCQVGCSAASDTSNGPVTPGAVATTSKLEGCQFLTALPTLANSQQAAAQCDSSGRRLVTVGSALPTGNNVIGQIGGSTAAVTVTPTITVAAYSAGQCIGGLMTFNNAARANGPGSGLVQSVEVTDLSGQDASTDLVLFNSNPTNSTFTDHATCTVNNLDVPKVAAVVNAADCHLLGATAPGVCQALQLGDPIVLGSSNTTLWGVLISRGTPAYTATTNISVRVAVLQD